MREIIINGETKVEATLPELVGQGDAIAIARLLTADVPRKLKEMLITAVALKHCERLQELEVDPFTIAQILLDRWEAEKKSYANN